MSRSGPAGDTRAYVWPRSWRKLESALRSYCVPLRVITITGSSDHDRPEQMITITGMRSFEVHVGAQRTF
jgi:hypothetical protein